MTVPSVRTATFVCFDGPKGVGKTTLLNAVASALRTGGRRCVTWTEKDLDPYREATRQSLQAFRASPSPAAELAICEQLARGRAWISREVLASAADSSVVLMDRWYPSDAAFRRLVPFEDVLRINAQLGVRRPDVIVAAVCPPEVSWDRVHVRTRGLDSLVVTTFDEHAATTCAFDRAAGVHGWLRCDTRRPVEQCAADVLAGLDGFREP